MAREEGHSLIWGFLLSIPGKRLQWATKKMERRNDSGIREVFIFTPGYSPEPGEQGWGPRREACRPVWWLSSCGQDLAPRGSEPCSTGTPNASRGEGKAQEWAVREEAEQKHEESHPNSYAAHAPEVPSEGEAQVFSGIQPLGGP